MTGAPAQWIVWTVIASPILTVLMVAVFVDVVVSWRHRRAEKRRVSAYLARLVD